MGTLQSLFDAHVKAAGCKVKRIVAELPDLEDRTALETALASDQISHSVISKVLREVGHDVSETQVRRHRIGSCACRD